MSSIILIVIMLFNACKKHDNNLITKSENNATKERVIKQNTKDDKCENLLKDLIYTSSIENPFKDTFELSIDKAEKNKMTIKLYEQSDYQKNAIGWVILDVSSKKLLDVTNDIENPTDLKYKNVLWNKFIDCYFDSNNINSSIEKSECKDISTEDGSEEVCFFKNASLENVYNQTIMDKDIEKGNFLLHSLPLKSKTIQINEEGLISISYIIKPTKKQIEFLFDGGVTTLILEQKNENVKRTIIYSAD